MLSRSFAGMILGTAACVLFTDSLVQSSFLHGLSSYLAMRNARMCVPACLLLCFRPRAVVRNLALLSSISSSSPTVCKHTKNTQIVLAVI